MHRTKGARPVRKSKPEPSFARRHRAVRNKAAPKSQITLAEEILQAGCEKTHLSRYRYLAPVEKALKLQRPLADKLLKVVATGEKKDAA